MPFVKGDPRINRNGSPRGARKGAVRGYNVNEIAEYFSKQDFDFKSEEIPDNFQVPREYNHIPRLVFRIAYRLFRSGAAYDKLFPSLKSVDVTSDGDKLSKPIVLAVCTAEEAADIEKSLTDDDAEAEG